MKDQFFGRRANVAYVDGMEYVSSVLPAWQKFIAGAGFPPLEALGPIAVIWLGYEIALVAETGELNKVENGKWATYHLEPK